MITERSPLAHLSAKPALRYVNALRAAAKALDSLADAMVEEAADGDRGPDDREHMRGAFGADAAASYCSISATLLREQGPPPRFVGGRAIWLKDDLDQWLCQRPVERTHARGRRRSGRTGGGKAGL